jgi:hypothetical protein
MLAPIVRVVFLVHGRCSFLLLRAVEGGPEMKSFWGLEQWRMMGVVRLDELDTRRQSWPQLALCGPGMRCSVNISRLSSVTGLRSGRRRPSGARFVAALNMSLTRSES